MQSHCPTKSQIGDWAAWPALTLGIMRELGVQRTICLKCLLKKEAVPKDDLRNSN